VVTRSGKQVTGVPKNEDFFSIQLLGTGMKNVFHVLRRLGERPAFLCVVMLCCEFAFGHRQTDELELQRLEDRAQSAAQAGNYPEAIRQYQELLRLRPGLTDERIRLGLVEHLSGDFAGALANFKIVLKGSPDLFVPNLFSGFALLKLKQPKEALPYLLRAQRINPKDGQAALGLGQAYSALQQFDKANHAYFLASVNAPGNSEAYYGLGITYLSLSRTTAEYIGQLNPQDPLARALAGEALLDQGKTKEAAAIYRALLNSGSLPNSMCWFLGLAHLRDGESATPSAEFKRALSNSPGCLGASLGLASLDLLSGNLNGALDHLEKVSKIDHRFLDANLERIWQQLTAEELSKAYGLLTDASDSRDTGVRSLVASSLKGWLNGDLSYYSEKAQQQLRKSNVPLDSAEQFFSKGHFSECDSALQNAPHRGTADELILAECAFDIGDYHTTFEMSLSLLAHNPTLIPALFWRARSASRLSIAALAQSIAANPESARAHLLLAETLRETRAYARAETEYSKALEVEPTFTPAQFGLASVYWDTARFDRALPLLESILASTPQDPEANYMVGAILVQRHRFEDAFPHLELALTGRPETVTKTHALLSKVYDSRGITDLAIDQLQQSLPADTDGSFHYQLAQLYKKSGNNGAAAKALQESEALRKKNDR